MISEMEKVKRQEFVISGMSGRLPESENLEAFWEHLIGGDDMITENNDRWDINAYNMPRRDGKVPNLDRFDAEFFGVSGTLANKMEPKLRILLEVTQEAIVDAGFNPKSIGGTSVGVFIASTYSEALEVWIRSSESPSGHYLTGSHPSLLANRITYSFNFTGPSSVTDTACSSSFYALQYAILGLRNGLCESAVVGAANINLSPLITQISHEINVLSMEGKCMAFDTNRDGYVRSEAVVALYICGKNGARRSYASIVGVRCNSDGYKSEGITVPSADLQEQLLREVYQEAGINPLEIAYVEAHGTGTRAGDVREIASLAAVFCPGRKGPLLVGSVKTNMGHAEPASGVIPGNLHFKNPCPDIMPLHDGRIKVVTEVIPFEGDLVGINSFGFGGTNAHLILRFEQADFNGTSNDSAAALGKVERNPGKMCNHAKIPTVIFASGRTKEGVEHFLDQAVRHSENVELIGLLHEIIRTETPQHSCLGFRIVAGRASVEYGLGDKPDFVPTVWFLITGLGSQWLGMTKDMTRFARFRDSIQLSSLLLKETRVNLLSVLETEDLTVLNHLPNAFVAIAAFQIGLIDLLNSVGVLPGGIIGHSHGECASGYADGCLTQEETLMAAWGRGVAFVESGLPAGTLASVGLSWEEVQARCPPDTFPVIHNAKDNVTVGGPPESVCGLVTALQAEGYFAKQVKAAMYSFHTPHLRKCKEYLVKLLSASIPEPKTRSRKWLSTSIPATGWDTHLAQHCSAEYLANNMLSPVLLYEGLLHIPEKSVLLEIGPHCFLQSILRMTLEKMPIIGLVHCKQDDNAVYFLNSLGKAFCVGVNVNISALYDPVKFPVASTTPSISSFIKWDHSSSWDVPHTKKEISGGHGTKFHIDLHTDEEYSGHRIHGQIVFPAAGYMFLAWKAFAKQNHTNPENLPCRFEGVSFLRMTELNQDAGVEFSVCIFKGTGAFEILENDEVVCSGTIRHIDEGSENEIITPDTSYPASETVLAQADFYTLVFLRGYDYKGLFQGVSKICVEGQWAELEWNDSWVSFLDTMLQTGILDSPLKCLHVPVRVEAALINPLVFLEHVSKNSDVVRAIRCKHLGIVQCPGIQLCQVTMSSIPPPTDLTQPKLLCQRFYPFFDDPSVTTSRAAAIEFFISVVGDNSSPAFGIPFILTEILPSSKSVPLDLASHLFLKFTSFDHRLVRPDDSENTEIRSGSTYKRVVSVTELSSLLGSNVIWTDENDKVLSYKELLLDGGFIILSTSNEQSFSELLLISEKRTETEILYLLRKISYEHPKITLQAIDSANFSWVEDLKAKLQTVGEDARLYIVSTSGKSGIVGFMKCLIREPDCENVRCIEVENDILFDVGKPSGSLDDIFKKDLTFNVYKYSSWGSYAYFSMADINTPCISEEAIAHINSVGDLSSLSWIEGPCNLSPRENFYIHFAGLNFNDVLYATGRLPKSALAEDLQGQEFLLGMEFSGTYRNRRVCGASFSSRGYLSSAVDQQPQVLFPVPDSWTLAEAATIPLVYSTVIYSLIIRARLRRGESVLVHSGSGAVGNAAIAIALEMNCEVFTTVGSVQKRKFLISRFPGLRQEQIFLVASKFERKVLRATKGKGVDVVLNSLPREKRLASFHCLRKGGRFLEIGKYDTLKNPAVGLGSLFKNISICGINMDLLELEEQNEIQEVMEKFFHAGKIKPLHFTPFGHEDLKGSFTFLAGGAHMGKVIIKVRDDTEPAGIAAISRTYFYPQKTYIIIGGLGGMGCEIVNWMIERGAKKLIIISPSGINSSYKSYMINGWRRSGAHIVVRSTDVTLQSEVSKLLKETVAEGPLGGFFNFALVLRDGIFINQSAEAFESVSNCKASATLHFDSLSRVFAPSLDYFVVFSSVIAGRGNPGQSNYGFGNSLMERVCEQRKMDGLPALAIQWGPVADVGSVAKIFRGKKVVMGLIAQPIASCISTMDLLLRQPQTVVAPVLLLDDKNFGVEATETSLLKLIEEILGINDLTSVRQTAKLAELGMDSVMGIQVRNAVQRTKNVMLTPASLNNLTVESLLSL